MQKSLSVGVTLAIGAGAMAALASVVAKLAMSEEYVHSFCVSSYMTLTGSSQAVVCDWVMIFLLTVT